MTEYLVPKIGKLYKQTIKTNYSNEETALIFLSIELLTDNRFKYKILFRRFNLITKQIEEVGIFEESNGRRLLLKSDLIECV